MPCKKLNLKPMLRACALNRLSTSWLHTDVTKVHMHFRKVHIDTLMTTRWFPLAAPLCPFPTRLLLAIKDMVDARTHAYLLPFLASPPQGCSPT